MPSTRLSPGTPPRLPSVPGVVFVLARTGANSPCRGFPAVVLAGMALEVPRVRDVARAAGFAETPHVDELVADRAVALHHPSVRLPIGTVADGAGWQALTRSPKVNLVSTVAGTFPLPSNRTECRQLRVERRMRQ